MVALLGLLAIAGYQNRDKLGAVLNSGTATDPNRHLPGGIPGQQGGASAGGLASALGAGGMLGGLTELFERFTTPGQQAKARSWVSTGRNESIGPDELEQALDEETIAELVEKTGLSRSELLTRLSQTLPEAVDRITPEGHFPPLSAPEPRPV
jgi:uncharacterized protein YidB (DUF937 family)